MKSRCYFVHILLVVVCILPACAAASTPEPPIVMEQGQLLQEEDLFGTFFVYVPDALPQKPQILLLVHGTPLKALTAVENAEFYAVNWIDFAEENGFVLITPVFNQEDFSSRLGDHAHSGYRGLFGREIGADEWLLRLVDAYQQAYGLADEQFYLYGHSAGGQFTARFMVTHPERVKRAVISSAATYPQPTAEVAWPFGMGELHTDIAWDSETIKKVDVEPDEQKWLAATQIPLTVIVGTNDMSELRADLIPGQNGRNRLAIAQNWVADMRSFAAENGRESSFAIEMIPGIGHSMSRLIPYSQKALLSP